MLISIDANAITIPVNDTDGARGSVLISIDGHVIAVPVIDTDGAEVLRAMPVTGHSTTTLTPTLGTAAATVTDAEGTSTL